MRKFRVYDKVENRYVTDDECWVITPDGELNMNEYGDLIGVDLKRYIVEYGTGLVDKNGVELYVGDKVKMFDDIYIVTFENGAYGLATSNSIDWSKLIDYCTEEEFMVYTGFCENDNFVSLWELYWNFSCIDNQIDEIEITGNIHEEE